MKKKATTLIEIVIYFTLLTIFMAAAFSFAMQIVTISELSSRKYDLATQSEFIQEKIKTTILTANSVNTGASTFDTDSGVLSLSLPTAAVSPTVFSLVGGELLMKEGNNAALPLNPDFVVVESLRFHRISYAKTPDQIQVDAVLTSPSDVANTDASISLHFTVSLRP